jgi:hypothetical protein
MCPRLSCRPFLALPGAGGCEKARLEVAAAGDSPARGTGALKRKMHEHVRPLTTAHDHTHTVRFAFPPILRRPASKPGLQCHSPARGTAAFRPIPLVSLRCACFRVTHSHPQAPWRGELWTRQSRKGPRSSVPRKARKPGLQLLPTRAAADTSTPQTRHISCVRAQRRWRVWGSGSGGR